MMAAPPVPFLRRTALLPDESLPSLLIRLEQCNFYDRPTYLRQVWLENLPREARFTKTMAPTYPAVYTRLAALTKLDVSALYGATIHRFAHMLIPPGVEGETIPLRPRQHVPILTRRGPGVARQIRNEHHAQYCPRCLEAQAYHRVSWAVAAIAACLEHRCLLISLCAQCHAPLTIRSVVEQRCGACGYLLTQAPLTPIDVLDEAGVLTQQILWAWAHNEAPPAINRLPGEPVNSLYRLVDGLRSCLMGVNLAWPYWHHPAIETSLHAFPYPSRNLPTVGVYRAYATAFKGVLDWPDGFYALLDAYRGRDGLKMPNGFFEQMGVLSSNWLERGWQHPAFAFVQQAFQGYLTIAYASTSPEANQELHHMDARAEHTGYATMGEATHFLQTSHPMVKRLIATGQLAGAPTTATDAHPYRSVSRRSLLAMKECWHDLLSLEEGAQLLGGAPELVVELVDAGVLESAQRPGRDGTGVWRFSRDQISACLERITRWLGAMPDATAPSYNLHHVVELLQPTGLTAGAIVTLIVQRRAPAYRAAPFAVGLGSIVLRESGVYACLEAVKEELGWMRRAEVQARLRIRQPTLCHWMQQGWISPCFTFASASYFERQQVETLAHQ